MKKFNVIYTDNFERELKRLSKKHRSIKKDLNGLFSQLENNPQHGTPLGKNCYKIRLAITSKGKGKSGGARVITHVFVSDKLVYLLSIYDKSGKDDISDKEVQRLLNLIK